MFKSKYVSHVPDSQGYVDYSNEEHEVWSILFKRQIALLEGRACDEFIHGIETLKLNAHHIPQLPDVNAILKTCSDWQVEPVPSLISAKDFFTLLANKKFPSATFIRTMEELNYVTEPDIFHEIFGHSPMLTESRFAEFMHKYASIVLTYEESYWPLLQRLFWFTVEFGLIKTSKGLRVYGGGILSSIEEIQYSVESHIPMRVLFDPLVALRVPYRIDELQKVYFVINDYEELYDITNLDKLDYYLEMARKLGEYPPFFQYNARDPNIHIHVC